MIGLLVTLLALGDAQVAWTEVPVDEFTMPRLLYQCSEPKTVSADGSLVAPAVYKGVNSVSFEHQPNMRSFWISNYKSGVNTRLVVDGKLDKIFASGGATDTIYKFHFVGKSGSEEVSGDVTVKPASDSRQATISVQSAAASFDAWQCILAPTMNGSKQ
ncbi:hypothetical protein GGR44_000539 [Sphingobium fontiphilum]|uniref:Uncharacterized protein n=1 Tax=Sphingobium fontiphilum TaxID=944425 RepID=A0A7W6DJC2_9SPHN|nr:hypothetical protein [Sphingobium fontiphilum]MBB3980908.1 hypothetical protein [Sphingobium fontiphilum]